MPDASERLRVVLAERYRIERELGRGGMAVVYLACDLKHDRRVALKVLNPDLAATIGADRFDREISIAAHLTHPNILAVHESGEADGFVFYTMPFVEGESLRDLLDREGPLSLEDVLQLTREVADALTYAHEQGVIHRDIKPENIMLEAGHAVVADFGIARAVGEAGGDRLTQTGIAVGTPAYMSPEQAAGEKDLDGRSDVYALGCVVYEMLMDQPPFSGPTAQAILARKATEPPPGLRVVRDVPEEVERAVMKSLARTPVDRFATAEAFVDALAAPDVPVTRKGDRFRNWSVMVAGLVVLVVALLQWEPWNRPAATGVDPNVIVIPPFRVSSADPSWNFLSEGMVDAVGALMTGEGGPRAVDSRTVLAAWRRAATESAANLPERQSLELARELGAGWMILGEVVTTSREPGNMTISASLISSTDENDRTRESVAGVPDSFPSLIDDLTALLLVHMGAEPDRRVEDLTESLPALRAYLEGLAIYRRGNYQEAADWYTRALELDSTFAVAGLRLIDAAEFIPGLALGVTRPGLAALRDFEDRLSPGDMAHRRAMATGIARERIDRAREALDLTPDRPEAWHQVGDNLLHFGALVGERDWLEQSRRAFARAVELDSTFGPAMEHLLMASWLQGDSLTLRRLGPLYVERYASAELVDFYRWKIAVSLGDTLVVDTLRRNVSQWSSESLGRAIEYAQLDGVGLAEVDRFAAELERRTLPPADEASLHFRLYLLRHNQGRPLAAEKHLEPFRGLPWPSSAEDIDILNALYWSGDRSAAIAAAARLTQKLSQPPATDDQRELQWVYRCVLALWNVSVGDRTAAEDFLEDLQSPPVRDETVLRGSRLAEFCPLIVETGLLPRDAPGSAPAVARLDSLARETIGQGVGWSATLMKMINLSVARLLEAQGDYAGALAAIRRREYNNFTQYYLSRSLLEEGRLAVMAADTTGAIHAYEHYLALRSNPERSMVAEAEQVRAELAELVAR